MLATLNVTSLTPHLKAVAALEADIVALQETTLTKLQQETVTHHVSRKEADTTWTTVWGAPRDSWTSKCAPGGTATGKRGGGVGVLVRQPCVTNHPRHTLFDKAYYDGRLVHSLVAIGKGRTFMHVFCIYAPSGNEHAATTAREKLLHDVLLQTSPIIGDAPAVVLGDFNTDTVRSPILRTALDNLWTDASQLQHHPHPVPITYTASRTNGSRIDYILLNRVAAQAFVRSDTFAVGDVPNHSCVTCELDLSTFRQTTLKFRVPRPLATPTTGDADVHVPDLKDFRTLLASNKLEEAWKLLASTAESYLLERCGIDPKDAAAYSGRSVINTPKRVNLAAGSLSSTGSVATHKEKKHDGVIRKVEHYVKARRAFDKAGGGAVPEILRRTWENCVRASGMTHDLSMTSDGSGDVPAACKLLHILRARAREVSQEASTARKAAYKRYYNGLFTEDRRTLLQLLKGSSQASADSMKRPVDGTLTADVTEMDGILQSAWDPILRLYSDASPEPDFEPFHAEFGEFINKYSMGVADITGQDLHDSIHGVIRKNDASKGAYTVRKAKKKSSACGVDGWRTSELALLPVELLDGFAALFNAIEVTGAWPTALTSALVSMLPKSEDLSPTNLRPITVTSAVYRTWACRRLVDTVKWQERWALPTQHGFRPGHRTDDVLLDLTTLIEETLLNDDKQLFVLALDFAKCFDRVPRGLVLKLAEAMGLHPRILKPLRRMYRKLRRRFKLTLGVGEEFEVTNGILQGCPLSVVLINALLSILLRAIEAKVPEVSTLSYADDANLLSQLGEEPLQRAIATLEKFCELTGMRINVDKTHAMGILCGALQRKRGYRSKLSMGGKVFSTVPSMKILGGIASTSTKQAHRVMDARVSKQFDPLECMSSSPLHTNFRAEIAKSSIVTSGMYGCCYAPISKKTLTQFSSRLTDGIMGKKHPSRSTNAVRSVLHEAHLLEPTVVQSYRILCNIFDTCRRSPHLTDRIKRNASRY